LKTLDFRLDTTVIGTVSANGVIQELDYRLLSLLDGSGEPLTYSHRHDDLVIELNKPLQAGESVVLKLELEGDILYRPNNDNYWRLMSNWYPQPVYWEMQEFTYHAVVKVAKPFKSFSSGHVVRRWQEDDLECAEYEELRPIAVPAMMAGKYSTVTEKSGNRTVHVSSYAAKQPRSAKTLAKLALGFMEFFEPLLGEYPFEEVNIVEINALGFGQAPAGIIYITREAFEPATDQSTRLYSEGINARIAHEVAHAWWGHVARLSTPEDQWISESLADYYGAVAMGALKSPKEFDTALSFWRRGAKDAGDSGTVYMANYITGDKASRQRHRLLYEKGPVVLHALRQELGDDAFFTIFKSFLRSFPGLPARTKDVIGLSSYVAKKDLRPWFDRYLFGTEIPEIEK
jgi:aminopeptidase N